MDQIEPSRPTLIDVMKEIIKTQQTRALKTAVEIDDLSVNVIDESMVRGVAVLSDN